MSCEKLLSFGSKVFAVGVCVAALCGVVSAFAADYPEPVSGVVTITTAGEYDGAFPEGMTKLVVDASGEVTISAAQASYTGATEIKSGTRLKAADHDALGGTSATVSVESGATLVITAPQYAAMSQSDSYYLPATTIAGTGTDGNGAIAYQPSSTVKDKCPDKIVRAVTLAADATISVTYRWGIANLDLAGHTLTRTGGSNWMIYCATITAGHIVNTAGALTWQSSSSKGTAENSSITVTGGTLTLWGNSGYPLTIPVYLKGGALYAGSGYGTAVNRVSGNVVITNNLASGGSIIGTRDFNFEGTVRSDALGTTRFDNSSTNIFSAAVSARDSLKLEEGTYLFKDCVTVATNFEVRGRKTTFEGDVSVQNGWFYTGDATVYVKKGFTMPRSKDFTCSSSGAADVFFDGDVSRANFGGLVMQSFARITLNAGTLCPRMLRVANGGAQYAVFHNAAGLFSNNIGDNGYIGESTGSFGTFVQEAAATSIFSNSFYVASSTNSYGFICQKGGLFTLRNDGIMYLGRAGHGFLWTVGGTNDSHITAQNSTRTYMSALGGTSTLVVTGTGSLYRTDSLLAGSTAAPSTNTIAVVNGATLRAHRFYSVSGRAAGSFSCVQIDGGTLAPSFHSGWGDAGTTSPTFYERTFDRITVHAGGVTLDTTGCLNESGQEAGSVSVAHNFERPSGRGIAAITLPTDATFTALKYKGPMPIIFEGAGYGATAYAEFDFATGKLTDVVVGSAGCDYDATTRAYILAPTGNPTKYACTITLTDDNRACGTFTKRGEKVALSLYGTNDCTGVIVESGTLSACGPRAVPQNVPVTVKRDARLYLNGGTYSVTSLAGGGTVANAAVTLANNGTISVTADEIFAAGATPLTFESTLTLGEGAKVVVTDPENLAKYKDHASVTILSAATLAGVELALEPASLNADWHVYKAGNTVRFGPRRGVTLLLR